MSHSPDPENSIPPSRLWVWAQRGVFTIVAFVMLGAMAYAARDMLAQLGWDPRAPLATAGAQRLIEGDNEYIAVKVRESAGDDGLNGYQLRLGVAYDDRIVYWRSPADAANSEAVPGSTIMTSREAGEILVAVGPILDPLPIGKAPLGDTRVVEIDGQPFAVVHREAVAGLMNANAGRTKHVTFGDTHLSVHGAIDLKHVS